MLIYLTMAKTQGLTVVAKPLDKSDANALPLKVEAKERAPAASAAR
jgi:hypothetical protein